MIMRSITLLPMVITTLVFSTVVSAGEAIIVGGGYALNASQGQIELNVKWVQSVLNASGRKPRVFYTDGDDPASDVRISFPLDSETRKQEPLSSVWSNNWDARSIYRSHTIQDVSGSTKAGSLVPRLKSIVSDTSDDLLFVYNGHGAQSPSNKSGVSLMLWDDTRLSANSLHELLGEMDTTASFRYVFTQCYSGGFHRLIYADPAKGIELHPSKRCGFTAESAYRLAEGCSSSINTEDYRDYTTFFFAALSGKDRNGKPVTENPDNNGDGVTTLREAHLYTLESAISTDLPRSSSEEYLSDWQPWYVRWMPKSNELPVNEYADLHSALLENNKIDKEGGSVKATRVRLSALERELNSVINEQYGLYAEMVSIQKKIKFQLAGLYPALLAPYSDTFAEFVMNARELVESRVLEHPDFERLIELQSQIVEMNQKILDKERQFAQMQKILQMRRLANLKDDLYRYGSNAEIHSYESLVGCEESPL